MKKTLTQSSHILQHVFENGESALSHQFIRWKLWRKWPDFVGQELSKVCEPVGYRQGTLFVFVINSSWMHQMFFGLDFMRDQINKRLGFSYVKAIHLTLNKRALPQTDAEKEAIRNSIGNIVDTVPEE